jgi:hypothetical protein
VAGTQPRHCFCFALIGADNQRFADDDNSHRVDYTSGRRKRIVQDLRRPLVE